MAESQTEIQLPDLNSGIPVSFSENVYQLAVDAAGAGTFYINMEDGRFVFSPALARMLTGHAGSNFSREDFVNHLHPDDRSTRDRAYALAAQTGQLHYEARFIWTDGSVHWMKVQGRYFESEKAGITHFAGIVLDITEEKRLKEAEHKLHRLVENSLDGMALLDSGNTITYINAAGMNLLGIDAEELPGLSLSALLPGRSLPPTGGSHWSGPLDLLHRQKREWIPFQATCTAIYGHGGVPLGTGMTFRDIRGERQAHQALAESEQRFRHAIMQAPVAIGVLKGPSFIVETANSQLLQIWGRDAGAVGKPLLEVLPEIRDQPFPRILEGVLASGKAHYGFETLARLKRNGAEGDFYFNFVYAPYYEEGLVTGVQVVATEVTSQVEAKRALEESEKRFRNLVYEAPVATAIYTGREMRISLANDAMLRLWGKETGVIGKTVREALPELEGQPFHALLDQVYEKGEAYSAAEARADLVVNGRLQSFYFTFTYKPLRNAEGQVYAILNMAVDVTELVLSRKKIEEAEAYFRKMTDTVPTMIWMTDREGSAHYLNYKWYDYTGQSREEALGFGWLDAVHPDDREHAGQSFMTANEKRGPYQVIYRLRNRTGAYRWCLDLGTPRMDDEGNFEGFTGSVIDINEAKEAEEALYNAEERLRLAAEGTGLGTWDLDLKSGAIIYSQKLDEIFGNTGSQRLTHQQMRDRLHGEDRKNIVDPAFEKALETGFYEYEARIVKEDGGIIWIRTQGKILFDSDGPARMVGTMMDITTQKQSSIALEESEERYRNLAKSLERRVEERTHDLQVANENLERSNAELAQYAYVASHDLQEPLRKIRVYSGILHDRNDLPAEARSVLDKVLASAERMTSLIKDLLEFSRLLKGGATTLPTDLGLVVSNVMADFELLVREKGAIINVGPLPVVQAVPLQMNQLFYNLVSNALKFSKADVPPRISISCEETPVHDKNAAQLNRQDDGYLRITVTDNGIGFDPQFAEQIFEIFKRLHARHAYPGSGIGLALCRKIAENHGGTLKAESVPGEGSRFIIYLPQNSVVHGA